MTLKRFRAEKLIRDGIPSILSSKGITLHHRVMDDKEFIARLKEKLAEEAEEVETCESQDELAEELADVLEVIHSLANASSITLEQIEELRKRKRAQKGGFDRQILSSFVEVDENSPSHAYYASKPHRYPRIESAEGHPGCIFCAIARNKREARTIAEFTHCFVIEDRYPVSKGHLLIIPKEHTENWFTAKKEVQEDILKALRLMKGRLDKEFSPNGYNIGANCGEAAGQTVMHLHVHLIPRYRGDMENPLGGVRGVIPEKQKYG